MQSSSTIAPFCFFLGSLLLAPPAAAAEPQSAMEILQRVQDLRSRMQPVRMRITMQTENFRSKEVLDIRAEVFGDKVRFDIFPQAATDLVHQNAVLDGDEVRAYRRTAHGDVCIQAREYAAKQTGQVLFDPRLLGLDETRRCDSTIRGSFGLDVVISAEIEGKEAVAGREAWKIKTTMPESVVTYWIDELNDRVYRVRRENLHVTLDIRSDFDAANPDSPIPVRVVVLRSDQSWQTTYSVLGLDTKAPVSPRRFSIASFDLPFNCSVVDYRIQRVLGYWNGVALTPEPTPPKR